MIIGMRDDCLIGFKIIYMTPPIIKMIMMGMGLRVSINNEKHGMNGVGIPLNAILSWVYMLTHLVSLDLIRSCLGCFSGSRFDTRHPSRNLQNY